MLIGGPAGQRKNADPVELAIHLHDLPTGAGVAAASRMVDQLSEQSSTE